MREISFNQLFIEQILGQELVNIFGTRYYLFKDKGSELFCEVLYKLTLQINKNYYSFELDSLVDKNKLISEFKDLHPSLKENSGWTYESQLPYFEIKVSEMMANFDDTEIKEVTSIGYLINKKAKTKEGFYIEINGYDMLFILKKEHEKKTAIHFTKSRLIASKVLENDYYQQKTDTTKRVDKQ
jgi:hypothetical protein